MSYFINVFRHGPVLLMTAILHGKKERKNDRYNPREQIKHSCTAVFYM